MHMTFEMVCRIVLNHLQHINTKSELELEGLNSIVHTYLTPRESLGNSETGITGLSIPGNSGNELKPEPESSYPDKTKIRTFGGI